MSDATRVTLRRTLVLLALSTAGGIAGMLAAYGFASELDASPAWWGPAIAIGAVAVALTTLLLLPTILRAYQAWTIRSDREA